MIPIIGIAWVEEGYSIRITARAECDLQRSPEKFATACVEFIPPTDRLVGFSMGPNGGPSVGQSVRAAHNYAATTPSRTSSFVADR